MLIKDSISRNTVLLVLWLKENTIFKKTWHIESVFVAMILVATAIISKKGLVELIGTLAVFFTFMHANVASRLSEAEEKRHLKREIVEVECYHKLDMYFYIKECLWFIYFIYLGAWSAIIGVVIFLLYPMWRKTYLKYNKQSF